MNNFSKKILVLCMIFIMSFSMFACGSQPADTGDDTTDITQEQDPADSEDQDETPDVIIPDGFADNAASDEDDETEAYHFGFTADTAFGMSGSVKKLNGAKISSQSSTLENQFEKALKASSLGSFDVASAEYDEYDGEEMDQQLYTLAMDNSADLEDIDDAAMAEAGMYHSSSKDQYHQYTSYISESFSEVSSSGIAAALKKIEANYGIKVKASKIEKAMKTVFGKVEENESAYSLYEEKTIKGDGYAEVVKLSVDGAMYEDGSMTAYIYVDRDRVYQ